MYSLASFYPIQACTGRLLENVLMFGPDIHDTVRFKILHKCMYAIKSIQSMLQQFCKNTYCKKLALKVHKHEFFLNTFFAETESLWSQGSVTRDF